MTADGLSAATNQLLGAPANNGMQQTALRAATDAEGVIPYWETLW